MHSGQAVWAFLRSERDMGNACCYLLQILLFCQRIKIYKLKSFLVVLYG